MPQKLPRLIPDTAYHRKTLTLPYTQLCNSGFAAPHAEAHLILALFWQRQLSGNDCVHITSPTQASNEPPVHMAAPPLAIG